MDCDQAQSLLLDRRRGTLDGSSRTALDAHLEACERCRHADAADARLSSALDGLPRVRAPETLARSLAGRWAPPPRRPRSFVAFVGLAACLAVFVFWVASPRVGLAPRIATGDEPMVREAVNDHLRVLYGEHPLEVESGGIHQVKPWFSGRLDFAPVVPFAGDDDFPLQGGAVAYFLDRKAAAFVFKRRLHTMTVFVFRADGLPWAAGADHLVGGARGAVATSRGFHVLLWRKGDLGYAVVSDVDARDVDALGARIAGSAAPP